MRFPEYRWIDTAQGGPHNRNCLRDVTRWRPEPGAVDVYRTYWRYPDAMLDWFQHNVDPETKKHSVGGYNGSVCADYLPVDFDDEEHLENALVAAKNAVMALTSATGLPTDAIGVFFSGHKGFHLLIPTACFGAEPCVELPRTFELIVERLFGTLPYDRGIYDRLRLLRVANTRHGATGLYRIALTVEELLVQTPVGIRKLAQQPRQVPALADPPNEELARIYRECLEQAQWEANRPRFFSGPAAERLAPDAHPCIAAMLGGYDREATGISRHEVSLRIASHFARRGMPPDVLAGLLTTWGERMGMQPERVKTELPRIAREACEGKFEYGCNDPIRQHFCAGRCPFRAAKKPRVESGKDAGDDLEIKSQRDAFGEYLAHVRKSEERRVVLGIPQLDRSMRGLQPGEVLEIIARTGVGKTAFLLNLLRSVSRRKIPSLFFSLEMPLPQVFERTVQIAAAVDAATVEQEARKVSSGGDSPVFALALADYEHVWYVDRDFLRVEQIERALMRLAERIGRFPALVAIDYLGRMAGRPRQSPYEITSEIAKRLKAIAKRYDTAVVYLHQTNRGGGDGTTPISLQLGRDSGQTEEAADFVLGMWRPHLQQALGSDTEEVELALLKARRGEQCRVKVLFRKRMLRMDEVVQVPDEEVF